VKAHAGEARVQLQVGLGQASPSTQNKPHKHPGPSRLCRREKRAEARKSAAKASKSDSAVEAESLEVVEDTVSENLTEVTADNFKFLNDQPLAEVAEEASKGDSALEAAIEKWQRIQVLWILKLKVIKWLMKSQDELCPDTIYYASEIPIHDDIVKVYPQTSQTAVPQVKQPTVVQNLSLSCLKTNPASFPSLFPPGSIPTQAITQDSKGMSAAGFPPISSRDCLHVKMG
jgi:hypothetical protein